MSLFACVPGSGQDLHRGRELRPGASTSSCPLRVPPSPGGGGGSEPNLLVRACNQLGQFLQHRETNLRYLALESMCTLASSEFSHEAVKTHIDTVINALKVPPLGACPGPSDPACVSSAASEMLGALGGPGGGQPCAGRVP